MYLYFAERENKKIRMSVLKENEEIRMLILKETCHTN
jgi:hypothetical protein